MPRTRIDSHGSLQADARAEANASCALEEAVGEHRTYRKAHVALIMTPALVESRMRKDFMFRGQLEHFVVVPNKRITSIMEHLGVIGQRI